MRPKLTFNDSIWNAYELKDIVSFSKGKNVSLDIVTETGFPAMMYGDIYIKYDTFFNKVDYCIPIELSKDSTIIDKNTILMTCTGETAIDIGKSICYLGETPICIGGDILALKCTDNTDAKFLCLQLNTYDKIKERARLSQGHSVVHLYQHHIEKSKIYKPDLATQTKIATFLNLYYKKIELQKKKIEQLNKLFTKAIDKISHLIDKKIQFYQCYVKASEGGTPSTSCPEYYENGNVPFVKIEDLYKKYIYNTQAFITEVGLKKSSAWLIPINSIIYSNGATIGEISLNKIEVATKQGILGIVPKKFILSEFLYYYMKTEYFRREICKITTHGTMMCAYLKDIDKINLYIPDINTQQYVVNKLNTIYTKIELEKQKLKAMEKYKRGLLQQLFV